MLFCIEMKIEPHRLQPFQTLLLLLLSIVAYGYDALYIKMPLFFLLVCFAILFQYLLCYIFEKCKSLFFPYSAATTAMSTMLMLYATSWYIYLFAITVGLSQKILIRAGQRHLFNPSNFAIVMAMLFFHKKAEIVTGQLGDDTLLLLLVTLFAIVMLLLAKRVLIPLLFAFLYLLFEYLFVVSQDPVLMFEDFVLSLYSVSTVVFLFFMITDPKTTPNGYAAQALFAAVLAAFSTLLDLLYAYSMLHPFLALFATAPLFAIIEQRCFKMRYIWFILALSVIIILKSNGTAHLQAVL